MIRLVSAPVVSALAALVATTSLFAVHAAAAHVTPTAAIVTQSADGQPLLLMRMRVTATALPS